MDAARYLPPTNESGTPKSNELRTRAAALRRAETQKWNCLRLKPTAFETCAECKSGFRTLT
jgi:hypothetical protein